jgi:hypothetical protein
MKILIKRLVRVIKYDDMSGKETLAYIQVRKHKKIYKVFLKDLKAVIRKRKNMNRPPVPAF